MCAFVCPFSLNREGLGITGSRTQIREVVINSVVEAVFITDGRLDVITPNIPYPLLPPSLSLSL